MIGATDWGPAIVGAVGLVVAACITGAVTALSAGRRRVLEEIDRRIGALEDRTGDTVEELAEIRGLIRGLLSNTFRRRAKAGS